MDCSPQALQVRTMLQKDFLLLGREVAIFRTFIRWGKIVFLLCLSYLVGSIDSLTELNTESSP